MDHCALYSLHAIFHFDRAVAGCQAALAVGDHRQHVAQVVRDLVTFPALVYFVVHAVRSVRVGRRHGVESHPRQGHAHAGRAVDVLLVQGEGVPGDFTFVVLHPGPVGGQHVALGVAQVVGAVLGVAIVWFPVFSHPLLHGVILAGDEPVGFDNNPDFLRIRPQDVVDAVARVFYQVAHLVVVVVSRSLVFQVAGVGNCVSMSAISMN